MPIVILLIIAIAAAAPPCSAADNIVFEKAKVVWEDGTMHDCHLIFSPDVRELQVNASGHRTSVPYDKILKFTYSYSDRRRVAEGVALGAATLGIGSILMASKARQHWLYVEYEEYGKPRELTVRLHKDSWERVLAVAKSETGKAVELDTPKQGGGRASKSSQPAPITSQPPIPIPAAPVQPTALSITSVPAGADIEVNGEFSGSTPSTLNIKPGQYRIVIRKAGYEPWERALAATPGGSVTLTAELKATEPAPPAKAAAEIPASPVVAPEKAPPHLATNSTGMRFVWIDPGSFQMGTEKRDTEKPPHTVTLTRGFYLQTTEVTQRQWEAVMKTNPSRFKGSDLPVDSVSWQDAEKFARELGALDKGEYRLPSEAEWEYACRAGGSEPDESPNAEESGWTVKNSSQTTHPVASRKPNGWGLFDMRGNVEEWVADGSAAFGYGTPKRVDPQSGISGTRRVLRGGSFADDASARARCGSRSQGEINLGMPVAGFRLVKVF